MPPRNTMSAACVFSSRERGVLQILVGPGNEIFPVGAVGVSAVVLPPGQLAVEHADVHGRHLLPLVIIRYAEIFRAEKPENRAGRDGGHVAALMIEPPRIAFFGHAIP